MRTLNDKEQEIHDISVCLAWMKLAKEYGVDTHTTGWIDQLGKLWAANAGTLENLDATVKEEDFGSRAAGAFWDTSIEWIESLQFLHLEQYGTVNTFDDKTADAQLDRVVGFLIQAKQIAKNILQSKQGKDA